MKDFSDLSYAGQIRRLRHLGRIALKGYAIQVLSMKFIHHGENTTFQITAVNHKKYLLRIHRSDYHTGPAIDEELKWLADLSKIQTVQVPIPVRSKKGHLVESVEAPGIPTERFCCVFKWIEGRFFRKSVKPEHLFKLGQLIGKLQKSSAKTAVLHRKYWDANGLVGARPKFGSLEAVAGISKKDQRIITAGRKQTLRKLESFQQKFPYKLGLIHADLHFGNIMMVGNQLAVIDFDDSGLGFYAYDLVVPLIAVEHLLGKKSAKLLPLYKKALLDGYRAEKQWSAADEQILAPLITARRLLMIGWLNSRADNPRLKKYLKKAVRNSVAHLNSIRK